MPSREYPNISTHVDSKLAVAIDCEQDDTLKLTSHASGAYSLRWKSHLPPKDIFAHASAILAPEDHDKALITWPNSREDKSAGYAHELTTTVKLAHDLRFTQQQDAITDIVSTASGSLLAWYGHNNMLELTQKEFTGSVIGPLVLATICPDKIGKYHDMLDTAESYMGYEVRKLQPLDIDN